TSQARGSCPSPEAVGSPAGARRFRRRCASFLRGAMEVCLLAMICLSPWAFGSVEAQFECLLYAGVAVLLGLWGARMLLEGRLTWSKCPVALCLAALVVVALLQLVPLPRQLLGWLSPDTSQLYDRLLPSQAEVLPFGEERDSPASTPGSTLSLDPGRTRQ